MDDRMDKELCPWVQETFLKKGGARALESGRLEGFQILVLIDFEILGK